MSDDSDSQSPETPEHLSGDSGADDAAAPDLMPQMRTLLIEARQGSDSAREELFELCRKYVATVARNQAASWLQAKVDASDLIQQSMLEAHRGFDNFRGESEGEWLAWLRQIVTHNAADHVRRYAQTDKRQVKREVRLNTPTASGERRIDLEAGTETPSRILMQHEREMTLAEALATLSDDHQEVIRLRNLQRLPFDDVAAQMGRTRGAAQMLWTRAMDQLRLAFKRLEGGETEEG